MYILGMMEELTSLDMIHVIPQLIHLPVITLTTNQITVQLRRTKSVQDLQQMVTLLTGLLILSVTGSMLLNSALQEVIHPFIFSLSNQLPRLIFDLLIFRLFLITDPISYFHKHFFYI